MADALRRKWYVEGRVLIETARILDAQFKSAVLCVTGAQLEVLRNLMVYLNRESTFASEYFSRYYLSPTVNEWDSLLAIVADLEEILMGNYVVPFGYSDVYAERISVTDVDAGGDTINFATVPEGEVWVVTTCTVYCAQSNISKLLIRAYVDSDAHNLRIQTAVVALETVEWGGWVVMKQGDRLLVSYEGASAGDDFVMSVVGFKMDVA